MLEYGLLPAEDREAAETKVVFNLTPSISAMSKSLQDQSTMMDEHVLAFSAHVHMFYVCLS